jgi:DNA-binding XRE family transcriptional regulator
MKDMNKPVRTTTPNGEAIVILPAAEYERLLELAEDARDLAIAEEAFAEFEANPAEGLTHREMMELLDASSPISFWRKRRGLTQSALARRVGIAQPYLAQIEGGKRIGGIAIYRKLSEALEVEIDRLDPGARPLRRRKAGKK